MFGCGSNRDIQVPKDELEALRVSELVKSVECELHQVFATTSNAFDSASVTYDLTIKETVGGQGILNLLIPVSADQIRLDASFTSGRVATRLVTFELAYTIDELSACPDRPIVEPDGTRMVGEIGLVDTARTLVVLPTQDANRDYTFTYELEFKIERGLRLTPTLTIEQDDLDDKVGLLGNRKREYTQQLTITMSQSEEQRSLAEAAAIEAQETFFNRDDN